MTIDRIFDREKAMDKIKFKFDDKTASVPSGLNISDAEMNDIADSLAVYKNKNHEVRCSDEDDEEMEAMRPVDSFFDKKKCINISIGTIIECQEMIFGVYCDKFVITEIKAEGSSHILKIRKINYDGTLNQGCWVNYDSDIIEVLSEEQFVTHGKIAIDKQIED